MRLLLEKLECMLCATTLSCPSQPKNITAPIQSYNMYKVVKRLTSPDQSSYVRVAAMVLLYTRSM